MGSGTNFAPKQKITNRPEQMPCSWNDTTVVTPPRNDYLYTTWESVVTPGNMRACVFCGESTVSFKKTMLIDEVLDIIDFQERHNYAQDVVHNMLRNMCYEAYDMHVQHNTTFPTVLCCNSCNHWIKRRLGQMRRNNFILPIQALLIHIRTLKKTDKKRFDSRIVVRLSKSLCKIAGGRVNIYYTILSKREKELVALLAKCNTSQVHKVLADYYRKININSMFVDSNAIAVLLRENC